MANIDKTKFKEKYKIDDGYFIDFLNSEFKTFKNILALKSNTYYISKEDINTIYNLYNYYRSIGIDNKTIYSLVINKIKPMIDNITYNAELSDTNVVDKNGAGIVGVIKDGVAYVVINIMIKKVITGSSNITAAGSLPSPKIPQSLDVYFKDSETTTNKFSINEDGYLRVPPVSIAGNYVCSISYPISY